MTTVLRLDKKAFEKFWDLIDEPTRIELTTAIVNEASKKYVKNLVNTPEVTQFLESIKNAVLRTAHEEVFDKKLSGIFRYELKKDLRDKVKACTAAYVQSLLKDLDKLVSDSVQMYLKKVNLTSMIQKEIASQAVESIRRNVNNYLKTLLEDKDVDDVEPPGRSS